MESLKPLSLCWINYKESWRKSAGCICVGVSTYLASWARAFSYLWVNLARIFPRTQRQVHLHAIHLLEKEMNPYCLNCHSADDSWTYRSRSCRSAHCSGPFIWSGWGAYLLSDVCRMARGAGTSDTVFTTKSFTSEIPIFIPLSIWEYVTFCFSFLFSCQCSGKPGINGVLFVKSLEVLLWTSLIGAMCISNENYMFNSVFKGKIETHIYF